MKGVRIIAPCVRLYRTSVPHLSLGAVSAEPKGSLVSQSSVCVSAFSDAPQKFPARAIPNEHWTFPSLDGYRGLRGCFSCLYVKSSGVVVGADEGALNLSRSQ